jgi:hypothetical protein
MHRSGRLALIKSTLAAMSVYISISIGLPGWMHKALEKIMKGFLWIGTETVQNGKCMVSWGKVQRPLRLGGLGLPNPKFQGIALRLRWPWLHKTDQQHPWSLLPMHEDMVSKAFFCASTVIIFGNGSKIKFWQDPWLDGYYMAELAPDLYQVVSCRRRRNCLVADAMVDGTWAHDVTGPCTVAIMMQFAFIHQRLQQVTLTAEQEDRWVWRWDSSGVFNVALAYQTLLIEQYPILGAKEVWRTKARAKCQFFVWLTLLGMH